MSLPADLLSTLFERRNASSGEDDDRPLSELVEELLTSRDDVSGATVARRILDRYHALDDDGRRAAFDYLCSRMDIDIEAARTA